jgi:hypothetical protein
MARIRTIKPEFPLSESIGRLSRDARLLFIQLWTVADDCGRVRAASRVLASLLYPFDDDAPGLIEGWLAELDREKCIVRYVVDGTTYLQIVKWLEHQKIDRPSKSFLPPSDDPLASPREPSRTLDALPTTLDHGPTIKVSRTVAKATRPPDEFLEFWKAYPKRQGSNPRKPAFEKWQRLVKSGIDPGKITAAVKAGAGFDGKKVGTEFIPQAIKWLNDQRFDDYEPPSEAARSQAYVRKDSPHWEHLARRWRQENKKEFGPPARDGWAFPIEWIPPSANGAAA